MSVPLVTMTRAISNGRPLSICGGIDDLRHAADAVRYLGTFFGGAVDQAACLATFRAFDAEDAFARMLSVGQRLVSGLEAAGTHAGLDVVVPGFPTMAMVHIESGGPGPYLDHVWVAEMVRRGVLVSPTVAWYVCAALTDVQVETVLDRAAECFEVVASDPRAGLDT